jgi:cobalt-precorrin-7 (C5)-methyltransferase
MITCVGVGPGDPGYLTHHAQTLLSEAQVVCGFDSVLNFVAGNINPSAEVVTLTYANQTDRLKDVAEKHHEGLDCVLAFMGDIHFSGFQLLERMERACGHPVRTIPGISSAQILASRTRVCFDETTFLTFHRRGDLEPFKRHLLSVLRDHRNSIVIPRPWDFMPKDVAGYLLANDISPDTPVEVWENLTAREAAWKGKLAECKQDFSDMSIMLLRTLRPLESQV